MDKNIAALLREDTYTIHVRFINDKFPGENTILGKDLALSQNAYTYVSTLPDIQVGDLVVVYAVGIPKVAVVERVDDEVTLKPNDSKEYGYVIAKVSFEKYLEDIKTNAEITSTVSNAYRTSIRKNFATMLLSEMDDASRTKLLEVIGKKKGE